MNGRFEQSDADGDEDYDGRRGLRWATRTTMGDEDYDGRRGRYDDEDFGRYDQRNGRSEKPGATFARRH